MIREALDIKMNGQYYEESSSSSGEFDSDEFFDPTEDLPENMVEGRKSRKSSRRTKSKKSMRPE